MANNGNDPTDGHPLFPESDAPQLGGDLEIVAQYAAQRGTRLIGSTDDRDAYQYPVQGLQWFSTTDSNVYTYDGSAWKIGDGADTGWVNCTYKPGFTTNSSAKQMRVRRDGNRVTIDGGAAGTFGDSTYVAVATIPVGFLPSRNILTGAAGFASNPTVVWIETDGTVSFTHHTGGSITWCSYTGSYYID